MSRSILVTEATGALGIAVARALADSGHRVYAGADPTRGGYRSAIVNHAEYAKLQDVQLSGVELALEDQRSAIRSVDAILAMAGQLDTVVHTTGCATSGPAEAFTAFQVAQIVDWVVLRAHRIHRAVLPSLRVAGDARVIWLALSGGTVGAACEAMNDRLADGFAAELEEFGIDFRRIMVNGGGDTMPVVASDDIAIAAEYPAAAPVCGRTASADIVDDIVRLLADDSAQ